MSISIERAEWYDADGERLRQAQRDELDNRYGADTEPGTKPSADDIEVFLIARTEDGAAVGCGALRLLAQGAAEIKRMFVVPAARGTGVSTRILAALEAEAVARGIAVLRLETGPAQPDAVRFYEREQYVPIPCFGYYADSPQSLCYERRLEQAS
ncbi:GNAT family N-acetyltransferase [Subtercola endophyticus]|uniref:GNAT family N-acetyltransferase n=1 Tax=Subtercola endophyticus TaxID=2895559 RepID=UPI001E41D323|nr:GNAT family N-acetyltransferase [Subtercola endophyticus]UFS58514.1 GNAT family N-acetyltransferase [Subtercola endophyticus]